MNIIERPIRRRGENITDLAAEREARAQAGGAVAPPTMDPEEVKLRAEAAAGRKPLHYVMAGNIEARLDVGGSLVRGLLDRGAMSVVYGESNVGKSFWVLDLAMHVAMGWQWRGQAVWQGAVVYVSAEGGTGINNRVVAMRMHYAVAPGTAIPMAVVPCPVDLLDPAADMRQLLLLIHDVGQSLSMPVELLVIDTLSRAMAGGDENSAKEMGQFVKNLDTIRDGFAMHLLVIHHAGKDTTKGARGHSLLRAATDTEVELIVTDPETKAAAALVRKQRDMPGGQLFAFRLVSVEIGTDDDGEPVTSAVVEPCERPSAAAGGRGDGLSDKQRLALDRLQDELAKAGEVFGGADMPPGMPSVPLSGWRERLFSGGVLDRDNDGCRVAFQRLKEGLLKRRRIGIADERVWVVPSEGAEMGARLMAGMRAKAARRAAETEAD